MIAINDNAINDIVDSLKNEGWNGNEEKLFEIIKKANEKALNDFSNEFLEKEDHLFSEHFIYKKSTMVDSFCNLYIFDKHVVIVEQEDNYGMSVDNCFDIFIDNLVKTSPLSLEELKNKTFIVKSTGISGFYKIDYDFENHWYSTNSYSKLPFDLSKLK